MTTRCFLALTFLLAAACGGASSGPDAPNDGDAGTDADAPEPVVQVLHPDADPIAPATDCVVTLTTYTLPSPAHVERCSELTLGALPPPGGDHYPVWADFAVYDNPVPWGFLMHSMEHGGVVLSHNCDGTVCDDVQAAFDAILADPPADDRCADDKRRLIVVPEPDQEAPVAAAAWGQTYEATCLDTESLTAFVTEHYAQGPENTCAAGLAADELVCP